MEARFTRKEVCELTSLTGNQVDYLCRQKFIVPEKIGSPKRPTVFYTLEQVIELKILSKLRKRKVPSNIIYSLIEHIRNHNYDLTLCNKYLLNSLKPDIRKQINYLAREAGVKVKKHYNPEKYALEIEREEEDYIVYTIATKEELEGWMKELVDNPEYTYFDIVKPIGDIHTEIKKAAVKYDIDLQKTPNLFDAALVKSTY